jgi:release factor glutamine methyltransferase
VNPGVLIPRQETEVLVDKCLELIRSSGMVNPRILEIGTGSGCISISIAKNTDCTIDAIDVDDESLSTAHRNSESHNVQEKINFSVKNFFTDIHNFDGYDFVLSNPPYIPLDEYNSLPDEIQKFEPEHALTDNSDGLVFYRKIIEVLKNTKNAVKVLLEIGDGKEQIVKELLNKNGIKKFSFFKDLININRVLFIDYTP